LRTCHSLTIIFLTMLASRLFAAPIDDLRNAIIGAERAVADHKAPGVDTAVYRTNIPLAKLKLRKAELVKKAALTGAQADQFVDTTVSQGLAVMANFEAGKPTYATPGALCECAYIAECDGTSQPYYLRLPKNYDPAKPTPLIVFLHGYVPSTSVLDPWILQDDICQIADDNGCILCITYGRRNSDFKGVGERDTLEAQEVVQSLYKIDPLRVYLSGVSMGGMGVWHTALRHPGRYAAATPMCGQTDMARWWQKAGGWPPRDQIPPFRRWMVEWDSPIDLIENARDTPIFVQHGSADPLVPVDQTTTIVEAAKKIGIDIKLYLFPGASHYIYWDAPCYKNAWGWEKDFKLDPSPRRVDYKTYSLDYNKSFWLEITDFEEWGKPATVSCTVSEDGSGLTLTTENVRQLKIDARQAPLKKGADFTATVNGKRQTVRATASGELVINTSTEAPPAAAARAQWLPRKRAGLCGPAMQAFDTPFIVVQGTQGSDAERADLATKTKRFADEWDAFADGQPRVRTDAEITRQDIQDYNLVLFGTPQTNRILGQIAPRLPISIADHRFSVAGKTYAGADLGLVMCYPNPLAPNRYVLIFSGEWYGTKCGINHKYDLVPDFIVFNTRNYNYDDTNEHEVAGFFGMNWEVTPKTTWVREGK
jgi:pimeloyl-ACP methyl ester carboxylesterase